MKRENRRVREERKGGEKRENRRVTVRGKWHFFKNNYIRQTILLVGQGLKLFWNPTNRVCYRWFWVINRVHHTRFPSCASNWARGSVHVGLEIESNRLSFRSWKSSLLDLVFVHGNRAQWTRFSNAEMERCQRSKFRDEQRRRNKQWCKTQQPRHRFLPNLGGKSFKRWKLDRTWFVRYQNSFKPWLTNKVVWIL